MVTYWILPYNPEVYNLDKRLNEISWVDWHLPDHRYPQDGDIVFAYATSPEKCITHKLRIKNAEIGRDEYREGPQYYLDSEGKNNEFIRHSQYKRFTRMQEIRRLSEIEKKRLHYSEFKDHGLDLPVRSMQKLSGAVVNFINSVIPDESGDTIDEIYKYVLEFQQEKYKDKIINIYRGDMEAIGIRLSHYTTISGMMGILDGRKFWLSDSQFMNDAEELRHASWFIGKTLERAANGLSSFIDDEFIEEFKKSTKEQRNYIACFCEDGDLLSQWRGYGNTDSPVSMGVLFRWSFSSGYYLAKVIYDDNEKREFIEGFIERLNKKYALKEDGYKYQRDLKQFLIFAKNIIKHSSFSEENEWRLGISALNYRDMGDELMFRESPFGLTPYVEFSFSQDGHEVVQFEEVVQGPRRHKSNAEDSLKQYFDQRGMSKNVLTTRIPLRKY